ncbi:uncharacterized protein LOC129752077 [Uranotaenia lowii]|uniref:uncharacterized protein LOC129752077 n=1 Tax=Uranotaenia lowii TaxID=190385 RepID=UPI0024788129|nr:uncharacterized protein LOC129752077 [Uranotaenia lowii]
MLPTVRLIFLITLLVQSSFQEEEETSYLRFCGFKSGINVCYTHPVEALKAPFVWPAGSPTLRYVDLVGVTVAESSHQLFVDLLSTANRMDVYGGKVPTIYQVASVDKFVVSNSSTRRWILEDDREYMATEVFFNQNPLEAVPANVGRLKRTTEISLADAALKVLNMSAFDGLDQMVFLTFINNIVSLKVITPIVVNMAGLRQFYCHQCSISELDVSKWNMPSLKCLSLVKNPLTSVPKGLSKLKKLQILEAYGNKIQTLRMDDFKGLDHLTTLSLEENQLTKIVVQQPLSIKALRFVELQTNKLLDASVLNQVDLPGLAVLNFADNNLTRFDATPRWKKLEYLNLDRNPLDCNWAVKEAVNPQSKVENIKQIKESCWKPVFVKINT